MQEPAPIGKNFYERVMVWINQNVIAQGAAEELLKVIAGALGANLRSTDQQADGTQQWCLDGAWISMIMAYRTMQYLVVCLSLGQTVSQLIIPQMVSMGMQTVHQKHSIDTKNPIGVNSQTVQGAGQPVPPVGLSNEAVNIVPVIKTEADSTQLTPETTGQPQVAVTSNITGGNAENVLTSAMSTGHASTGLLPTVQPAIQQVLQQAVQPGLQPAVQQLVPADQTVVNNQTSVSNGITGQNNWVLPSANNPGYMVVYQPNIGLVLTPVMPTSLNTTTTTSAAGTQPAQQQAFLTADGQIVTKDLSVGLANLQNQQVCVENSDTAVPSTEGDANKGQFQTIGSILSELTGTGKSDGTESPNPSHSSPGQTGVAFTTQVSQDMPVESEGSESQEEGSDPSLFKFICPICQFVSRTKRGLAEHRRRRHLERPFKCKTCLKCFSEEMFLRKHIASSSCRGEVIGESKLVCKICTFVSQTERGLSEHIRRRHLERPFKCELCNAAFSDEFYLRKHRIEMHNLDLHTCDLCGAEAKTLRSLAEHKSKIHNIRVPKSKKSSSSGDKDKLKRTEHEDTSSSNSPLSANQLLSSWPVQMMGQPGLVMADAASLATTQANGLLSSQIASGQQPVFPGMAIINPDGSTDADVILQESRTPTIKVERV